MMLRSLTLGLSLAVAACSGNDDAAPTSDSAPTPTDTGPEEYFDSFPQTLRTPIDVLWVVDTAWDESQSSITEELLTNVFETYLLADPAWKIGVVDPRARGSAFGSIGSQFETWPRTQNPFVFPEVPDSELRIREAIYSALELRLLTAQNEDFIRSDAHLYVVVMTNEEDQSSDDQITLDDFEAWFKDYTPSETKHLSVLTDDDSLNYWSKRTLGDGIAVGVNSWGKAMEKIFLDSMAQRTTFTLTQTPVDPPVVARVVYRERSTEYLLDVDFTYDPVANSITFLKVVPEPDSVIEVVYVPADGETEPTTATSSPSPTTP